MDSIIDQLSQKYGVSLSSISASPMWSIVIGFEGKSVNFEFDENNFPIELGSADQVFKEELEGTIIWFMTQLSN